MKKLKVAWFENGNDRREAEVHAQSRISLIGSTLVFQDPSGTRTVLVIPERALVSAVTVEVEGA